MNTKFIQRPKLRSKALYIVCAATGRNVNLYQNRYTFNQKLIWSTLTDEHTNTMNRILKNPGNRIQVLWIDSPAHYHWTIDGLNFPFLFHFFLLSFIYSDKGPLWPSSLWSKTSCQSMAPHIMFLNHINDLKCVDGTMSINKIQYIYLRNKSFLGGFKWVE